MENMERRQGSFILSFMIFTVIPPLRGIPSPHPSVISMPSMVNLMRQEPPGEPGHRNSPRIPRN